MDKVLAFVAPLIIGGREAPSAVSGKGIAGLQDAPRLVRTEVEWLGEDLLISGYPRWADS